MSWEPEMARSNAAKTLEKRCNNDEKTMKPKRNVSFPQNASSIHQPAFNASTVALYLIMRIFTGIPGVDAFLR
jgi:hypothetical protein